jgi:hypothetical protein
MSITRRTHRAAFFIALLLAAAFALPAAGQSDPTATVYVIRNVEYRIDGRTREFALRYASEIKVGDRAVGEEALKAYIDDKTQILINQRVIATVRIESAKGEAEADGTVPVDLVVYVEDTWNAVALPYGKYDSNDGLELVLKARDYNFLGTMQPLRIDLGYQIDPKPVNAGKWDEGSFVSELDTNIPFIAFDYKWNVDFDHILTYGSSYGLAYENKTGVSVDFPIRGTTLTVGAFQGVSVNEENDEEYKAEYGERYDDEWYLSNWMQADWEIPTGYRVNGFGELTYTPRAIVMNKYRPGGDIGEERRGPTVELGQKLEFGRVDWIGNYRRGLEVTIDNANVFNLHYREWDRSVTASATGHLPIASFFGISSRLSGTVHFDKPDDEAGVPLRGIMDDSVIADAAIYLNTEFPLRLIRFVPYEWFGQRHKWMKIFQFEQQWSPFVDAALVKYDDGGVDFDPTDPLISAGLEVVTFPLFFRSLYVRISLGFNVETAREEKGLPSGDGRELFIGIGHHY